jgi:hypothetical protein
VSGEYSGRSTGLTEPLEDYPLAQILCLRPFNAHATVIEGVVAVRIKTRYVDDRLVDPEKHTTDKFTSI